MNENYQFISNLVDYLSWPFTVILISLCFKRPILALFNRIEKIKTGDNEAYFSKQVQEIKDISNIYLKTNSSDVKKITITDKSFIEEVEEIANVSPEAAIPFAWTRVEQAIRNTINRVGIQEEVFTHNQLLSNINKLIEMKKIDKILLI